MIRSSQRFSFLFVIAFAFTTLSLAAETGGVRPSEVFGSFPVDPSWHPEKEIPNPVFVGPSSEIERQMAAQVRNGLIQSLIFWQQHGLPNPPDVEGFYIVTDVRDLQVEQVLALFNPDIPNIKEHLNREYSHLFRSRLVAFATKIGARIMNVSQPIKLANLKTSIASFLFDKYASNRYLFSVPNILSSVNDGLTVREAILKKEKEVPTYPMQDNAFYGRFLRFDLHEILPLAEAADLQTYDKLLEDAEKEILEEALPRESSSEKLTNENSEKKEVSKIRTMKAAVGVGLTYVAKNLTHLVDFSTFQKLMKQNHRRSPRIVILPRSEQETLGSRISTLGDASVSKHELGHHIAHTIHDSIHRLIDEVMADYLAAAPEQDPKIGEFFAKSSGDIAKALLTKEARTHENYLMGRAFAKLAERGLLRDLSDETNIDQLNRKYQIANDYDAGDPLRTFLWKLRFESQLPADVVDRMVIQVMGELDKLPMLMSSRTSLLLQARGVISTIRESWMQMRQKSHLISWIKEVQKEEIDQLAEKLYLEKIAIIEKSFGGLQTKNLKRELKKLAAAARQEAQKSYLESQMSLIDATAKGVVTAHLSEREDKSTARRLFWRKFGFGARPAIQADYVIPEFLRAMYRVAALQGPEAQALVQKYAEFAMNSSSVIVAAKGSPAELVFMKSSLVKLNPVARIRLNQIIANLAKLRSEHIQTTLAQQDTSDQSEILKVYNRLYGAQLERLQEFERTGSVYRLFSAHPVASSASAMFHFVQKLRNKETSIVSCQALF